MHDPIKKALRSFAVVAAATMTTWASITSHAFAQQSAGGEVIYAVHSLISPTDMILYKVPIDFIQGANLYDTLYRTNLDGKAKPWLAEQTSISADARTWTLQLRKGVQFHDGTPFNAEAVKWNLERRQHEKLFQLVGQLKPIAEIHAVDEETVKFTLSHPVSSLMVALSSPAFGMQSPTAYKKYPNPKDYALHAAGTGPFKLSSVPATTTELKLVRNEAYWAGKPQLRALTFQALPDESARVASLESGDIHYAAVPLSDVQRLSKSRNVRVDLTDKPITQFYVYANFRHKLLSDVRVRRALAYALNQADLAKLMYGLGQPADSLVVPSVAGYSRGNPYSYRPELAKQLLAEAGIAPGTKLTVLTYPNGPALNLTQLIKQQFDAIGFAVTIDVRDLSSFVTTVTSTSPPPGWQIAISNSPPHYPDAEATYFRSLVSNAFHNWGGYQNPEVDRLLSEQVKEIDPASRQQLLDRAQALVFSDAAILPIAAFRFSSGAAKELHGVEVAGLTTVYFDKAWLGK